MLRDELKLALDRAPVLSEIPDSKAEEVVQDLLKHPGLPLLYGLMLGSRQAHYAALAVAPLNNMETVARAAVIQGTIAGIELFAATVLTLAVPSQDEQESNQ